MREGKVPAGRHPPRETGAEGAGAAAGPSGTIPRPPRSRGSPRAAGCRGGGALTAPRANPPSAPPRLQGACAGSGGGGGRRRRREDGGSGGGDGRAGLRPPPRPEGRRGWRGWRGRGARGWRRPAGPRGSRAARASQLPAAWRGCPSFAGRGRRRPRPGCRDGPAQPPGKMRVKIASARRQAARRARRASCAHADLRAPGAPPPRFWELKTVPWPVV